MNERYENIVKLIGTVNYNSQFYKSDTEQKHTFLTIKTRNQQGYDVYIRCVDFNKKLDFQKGEKVEIMGEVSSWFNKEKNISNQSISIIKIERY